MSKLVGDNMLGIGQIFKPFDLIEPSSINFVMFIAAT